jgi:hypothetical protein
MSPLGLKGNCSVSESLIFSDDFVQLKENSYEAVILSARSSGLLTTLIVRDSSLLIILSLAFLIAYQSNPMNVRFHEHFSGFILQNIEELNWQSLQQPLAITQFIEDRCLH